MGIDCNEVGSTRLAQPELEARAQAFTASFATAYRENRFEPAMIATKNVAQQFLKDLAPLSDQEAADVLRRTQALNDQAVCKDSPSGLPMLNIVLSGAEHNTLAKFSITQRPGWGAPYGVTLEQDLYLR